jgi:hypothetical protein
VLLETFLLALMTGFLFKGSIKNLAKMPFHGAWFIWAGLILRNIPAVFRLPFLAQYADAAAPFAPFLFLAAYILLVAGIGLNLSHWPMIILLGGILLNFAVVLANAGFMPVSGESLRWAGYDMSRIPSSGLLDMNHILTTAQTRLPFLSDILAIQKPYPFPQVISIGDVLMCLGLLLFIVIGMSPKKRRMEPTPYGTTR